MTNHCVILAAGVGSRISEHTQYRPKALIEVNEKPIIASIIDSLMKSGIQTITITIGYKAELLKQEINNLYSHADISINFVENEDFYQTNTMYSLYLAKKYLKNGFLFVHGDLIFPQEMLAEFLRESSPNSVLIDENVPDDWDDAMKVITRADRVNYMSKSITRHEADGTAVGMYKFDSLGSSRLFAAIESLITKGVLGSWVSEPINIISKDIPITTCKINKYQWCDVDNTADLKRSHSIS
jgi:L-glutamine-phosphate cytidylyltransferase